LANKNRQVSLDVVRQTMESSELVRVLFVMSIDSSMQLIPFANVRDVSYDEKKRRWK
jgi:hypothetical protein